MKPVSDDFVASTFDTVDEIIRQSNRRTTPLRTSFLQQSDENRTLPGPLAGFVARHDTQALLAFLLVLTKASTAPWETALPSSVWARALGAELPRSKTAGSNMSKLWRRLENAGLIHRQRYKRMARVYLRKEDGSGDAYELPAHAKDRYLQLPAAFWTQGPDEEHRWYLTLTLPEIAMLLIARSLGDGFRLPLENVHDWYGISADTAARGLHGLESRGLIEITKFYKKAPLSPVGYTAENRYTLQSPFGPKGRAQSRGIRA
ncbi:MAG: hypothetical protein R2733_17070 [Acidimicrobiales bacterium]